jgi:hypothetical protein
MKLRVSIIIGEDPLDRICNSLRSKKYRNKSHFFEIAAATMLKGEKNES